MPNTGKAYVNPFYREVDGYVQTELNTRASFYGRKVRGVGKSFPRNVVWSYQKTAWARVISVDNPSITLGFPGSKVMSGPDGKLTLYSSQRNVPKKPLLTGIEISNEGTVGSLLKGKFTFTAFPVLTSSGFDLGKLEEAFFTPGKEVEISWGWSIAASSQKACIQEFTGIIYNFNWSFNNDMSISADVSIVSAATIALGQSGDQSAKQSEDGATDPQGVAIKGDNLITIIDQDLAALSASINLSEGQSKYVKKDETTSKKIEYYAVGLPFQESSDVDDNGNPKNKPIPRTFWYVKFGSITEFLNQLVTDFEKTNSVFSSLYRIVTFGNEAAYNKEVKSSNPINILFPDAEMGSYGQLKPFENDKSFTSGVTEGTFNIGGILLGTDYIKETYRGFVIDNATNIPFKNITKLIEELSKGINAASGDVYQLTPQMYEPRQPSGKLNASASPPEPALLSVEDFNLAKAHTEIVTPYKFDATIFKPLIKNISLSSKPPGPLATAAYAQARGTSKGGTKVPPNNSDVSVAARNEKQVDGEDGFDKQYTDALDTYKNAIEKAKEQGFNEAWSDKVRSSLVKIKKMKVDGKGDPNGAHWLNKAIYPIDLTLTIDGIAGFKFGDVISTSLIPKQYTKYKMVFTITKISHSVKDGVWETTLNTKSRISMDVDV
jgi:hypothetical protein